MSVLVYNRKSSYLAFNPDLIEMGSMAFKPEEKQMCFMPELGVLTSLNSEASANGKIYESFVEALAAATGDVEIKLLSDVVLAEPVIIPVGANVVLDLNGHSINSDAAMSYSGGMITIVHGSSLVVNGDGSISTTDGVYSPFQMTHKQYADDSQVASLTINGGHYVGRYYVICGNGLKGRGNSEIIINDGLLETYEPSDGAVIFNPQENSSVIVNGGSLVANGTGIEMRSGNLTINGGSIETFAAPAEVGPNRNGTTAIGSAIAVCQHTTKNPINVVINDGDFRGYHALFQANPQKNDDASVELVNMAVNGGTFTATHDSILPVYSENKTHFIHGGDFSPAVSEEYLA
jgi:hypothetical protein